MVRHRYFRQVNARVDERNSVLMSDLVELEISRMKSLEITPYVKNFYAVIYDNEPYGWDELFSYKVNRSLLRHLADGSLKSYAVSSDGREVRSIAKQFWVNGDGSLNYTAVGNYISSFSVGSKFGPRIPQSLLGAPTGLPDGFPILVSAAKAGTAESGNDRSIEMPDPLAEDAASDDTDTSLVAEENRNDEVGRSKRKNENRLADEVNPWSVVVAQDVGFPINGRLELDAFFDAHDNQNQVSESRAQEGVEHVDLSVARRVTPYSIRILNGELERWARPEALTVEDLKFSIAQLQGFYDELPRERQKQMSNDALLEVSKGSNVTVRQIRQLVREHRPPRGRKPGTGRDK